MSSKKQASRRKSVAFAMPEDEEPSSSRARRDAKATEGVPPSGASVAPAGRSAIRKAPPAQDEADVVNEGGFKFKRRKAQPAAPAPAAPAPSKPAATSASAAPADQGLRERIQGLRAKPKPAAPAASSKAKAPVAADAPAAPQLPPSALRGASHEMLQALLQTCQEAKEAAARGEAAPLTTELAISACMQELTRLGVVRLEGVASEENTFREREASLRKQVEVLERCKLAWDTAAEAGVPPAAEVTSDEGEADEATIASLPPLPPVKAKLEELGALAGLCADQVDGACQLMAAVMGKAEEERTALAKAAHATSFANYLDVDQPKLLLRAVTAV